MYVFFRNLRSPLLVEAARRDPLIPRSLYGLPVEESADINYLK